MEIATDAPPSVLKIASMFASLSAQTRRAEFARNATTSGGGIVKRSIEIGETFRAVNPNSTTTSNVRNTIFISTRMNDTANRTRSRSSDSRPVCLDLKVLDNRTKFHHAKAVFESLERQSRQEQRQRTPHNNKKRVASPSPTRSSTSSVRNEFINDQVSTNNNSNVVQAGQPVFRTIPIRVRDYQPATSTTTSRSPAYVTNESTLAPSNAGGTATTITRLITTNNAASVVPAPPPVPPKPKLIDSPRTSTESSSSVNPTSPSFGKVFQRTWTADSKNGTNSKEDAVEDGIQKILDSTLINNSFDGVDKSNGGLSRNPKINQLRRNETENGGSASTWSSLSSASSSLETKNQPSIIVEKKSSETRDPLTSAVSVNTTLSSQVPDNISPQKPSSLFEPYWRSNRLGRQRFVNGDGFPERSLSPPNETSTQISRNYMLKSGSQENGSFESDTTPTQSKLDPGRLDITWPPPAETSVSSSITTTFKSPVDETKDSGVGTDSPSTSTTDSRASSSMNAAPPAPLSNGISTPADSKKLEERVGVGVDFMTKEEASVLLSPTTRDVVLRETPGRTSGDDHEVRSLTSRLSIPQDVVDLKRLSTCSMESSTEQGSVGLATDRYSIPDDMNVNLLSDGHFWIEVAGLQDEPPPSPSEATHYKKPSRVKFTNAPIKVFSTYTGLEYDRRNDEVDPVSASAEYELERRLDKMDILDIELQKGPEGLGFSIIGMGVGADAGLEKLGIFVKSITPGGAVHRDGRICVCDQIVEVDGKSLVGVSQNYAASVLRSTSGTVTFKIGREKDLENSEIAALIRQSLEQDRLLREQEEILQRRLIGVGNAENVGCMEMRENPTRQDTLPPYSYPHYQPQNYSSNPSYSWNDHHRSCEMSQSAFSHADDDETPEQLISNDPHLERLMSQLKEPLNVQNTSMEQTKKAGDESEAIRDENLTKQEQGKITSTAFRNDPQSLNSTNEQCTYTAAEDISRLLSDSVHTEDLETRFPSNSAEPEIVHDPTIQPSFTTSSTANATVVFGQLRRTTPELTSSMDSMNGSEIQSRINNLEAELSDVRQETEKYQTLLNDSQSQYDNLEKKYGRAKKLIRDYQDREKDLLDRESEHLRQLREKDQQCANLIKMLKDKIGDLEKQLQDAHRKRASIVEATAAAANLASNQLKSAPISLQSQSDISAALAYLPAKKLESVVNDSIEADSMSKLPTTSSYVRNVPIIRQPPSISEIDGIKVDNKLYVPDFGVPQTELLDSTVAKCKAEVVKQSQVMAARALPTRRRETEVFIMCHHTLEHAHALCAHASGSHCGSGGCNNSATASPCAGLPECSTNLKPSSPGKTNNSISTTGGSPSTPRKLTALLLRKKASVNNACSATASSPRNMHLELNSSKFALGGGDMEKLPAVLTWTCDEVCRFLKSLGLEKYTPEFSINRVDGCKLLQLDGSKLKAMGVQNHSDRALIKKQIKEMKAHIERERKQMEKESRRLHKLEKEKRQK